MLNSKGESVGSEAFTPTHVIYVPVGSGDFATETEIPVCLEGGAAYTQDEWYACENADYERQDNGDWTFQGQPFTGTVKAL